MRGRGPDREWPLTGDGEIKSSSESSGEEAPSAWLSSSKSPAADSGKGTDGPGGWGSNANDVGDCRGGASDRPGLGHAAAIMSSESSCELAACGFGTEEKRTRSRTTKRAALA